MKLSPKKWADFQHYKDRCPPWIKLHRDLLNNRDFISLPLASKALAPMLWLLASESNNATFDASLDELEFRLRFSKEEIAAGLKPLIDKGFFIVASGVLADCLQGAIPETEGETEAKTETKTPKGVCPQSRTPSQQLVDIFHEKCTFLPRVTVFNDNRRRTLQGRFKEVMASEKWTPEQTIEWFGEFYGIVNESKFLTGRAQAAKGGRVFKADWDWIHGPQNFVKIVEGKYSGE